MRCPKCGAGLTGTRKSVKGKSIWWCKYCQIEVTVDSANCQSLDKFIKEDDRHG